MILFISGHGTPTLGERKPRKFVVFINPMAGVQRGESEFYTCVKPMFDVAEIDYEVKVTSESSTFSTYHRWSVTSSKRSS